MLLFVESESSFFSNMEPHHHSGTQCDATSLELANSSPMFCQFFKNGNMSARARVHTCVCVRLCVRKMLGIKKGGSNFVWRGIATLTSSIF